MSDSDRMRNSNYIDNLFEEVLLYKNGYPPEWDQQ